MVRVMIGIDPHKGPHTAAAIDPAEIDLVQLRVRAAAAQVEKLLSWAEQRSEWTWAGKRRRAGLPVVPAAVGGGRGGVGRAAQAGRPGASGPQNSKARPRHDRALPHQRPRHPLRPGLTSSKFTTRRSIRQTRRTSTLTWPPRSTRPVDVSGSTEWLRLMWRRYR